MGGYGSGRKFYDGTRHVVEEGLLIDGYRILPQVLRLKGERHTYTGEITWKRNNEPFAWVSFILIGLNFTLSYTRNGESLYYPVSLTTTNQPKGGLRYWFICPLQNCGRRTAKLYLPNGAKYFGCRKCYNLTYSSCNESHKNENLFRLLAKDAGTSFQFVKKMMRKKNWK
jgi:hypothetical protein